MHTLKSVIGNLNLVPQSLVRALPSNGILYPYVEFGTINVIWKVRTPTEEYVVGGNDILAGWVHTGQVNIEAFSGWFGNSGMIPLPHTQSKHTYDPFNVMAKVSGWPQAARLLLWQMLIREYEG